MYTTNLSHTASPVAQDKKGRVQDLGRGSCSKSTLQSPASGLPSGVADVVPFAVASGSGKTEVSEPMSGGAANSGQQHPGTGAGTSGLTRTQKRNLRRKFNKLSSNKAGQERGAGTKRPRSDGSTPSPAGQMLHKKPREDFLPGSYSGALKASKLAVVKESFPASKLSEGDGDCIRGIILEKTDSNPVGCQLPEILGCNLRKGALIVSCGNSATEDWIRKTFNGKRVLGDEALKVISADELPKPFKVSFKTSDNLTKDHSVFLKRLAKLNPELKSEEWRVLQVFAEQHSTRWIFEVEAEHIEAIRSAKFGALTGLDRGIFKILHEPKISGPTVEKDVVGPETSPLVDTSPSVDTSPGSGTNMLNLSDMALDSSSEGTLQPDSPPCETDVLQLLHGEESLDSSHAKGQDC